MSGSAYSFSRISLFEQCARRFRYRYLDGVKEAFDSVEGFMGRRVHDTVEWLFAERTRGRVPSAAETVTQYCRRWDEEVVGAPRRINVVKRGEDVETYRRAGAEILHRFYRERFIADKLETVATEKHFTIPLGGRYVFQGYIDRLARDAAGRLHVIDYKTGRRMPETFAGKEAEQDHQPAHCLHHACRALRPRCQRDLCAAKPPSRLLQPVQQKHVSEHDAEQRVGHGRVAFWNHGANSTHKRGPPEGKQGPPEGGHYRCGGVAVFRGG